MIFSFLTGKPKEILDSINGIVLTHEENTKFADIQHDDSEIHRNIEIARLHGFSDTPITGVHLVAIGDRIASDILSVMQTPSSPLYLTSQSITFRDPVYPGEPISWNVKKETLDEGDRSYAFVIPNREPGKKPRVEMVSEFASSRPIFKRGEDSRLDNSKLVYSEDIKITSREVKGFYECRREQPINRVASSHAIGRIPSVLLSFCKKLNALNGTQIGGKNIEMVSSAYDEVQVGDSRVDVYEIEKSGRGHRSSYTFEGVLYQNGTPRVSTRVKALVNGEFGDIYALRPKIQDVA